MHNTRRYLSVGAAKIYSSLSATTLWRMLNDGRLTRCQPAGLDRVLIDKKELDAVLRGKPAKAAH
jgi:hypothetical protein